MGVIVVDTATANAAACDVTGILDDDDDDDDGTGASKACVFAAFVAVFVVVAIAVVVGGNTFVVIASVRTLSALSHAAASSLLSASKKIERTTD
jgi:hypothetical protein